MQMAPEKGSYIKVYAVFLFLVLHTDSKTRKQLVIIDGWSTDVTSVPEQRSQL